MPIDDGFGIGTAHLARVLSQRSGGHSIFFTRVGPFHYYTHGKDSCTENFTVVFTENLTHAQTVCTRPFLLLLKGPRDEAMGLYARLVGATA